MLPDPKAYCGIKIIEKPTMRVGGLSRGERREFLGMFRQANEHHATIAGSFADAEDFNRRYGTSIRIISPGIADIALRRAGFLDMLGPCSPFPTSTLVGFEKPGNRLGREIVFNYDKGKRIILPTGRYMGEGSEGVALTVAGIRAADFKSDGDDIVVDILEARLEPHAGFPDRMGWHMFRDGEVVPSSEKALKGRQSRFMFRNEEPFVGPACRGISNKGSGWNVIFLYLKPSFEGGTVVEIPEADLGKFAIADLIGQLAAECEEPPSLKELVELYKRIERRGD